MLLIPVLASSVPAAVQPASPLGAVLARPPGVTLAPALLQVEATVSRAVRQALPGLVVNLGAGLPAPALLADALAFHAEALSGALGIWAVDCEGGREREKRYDRKVDGWGTISTVRNRPPPPKKILPRGLFSYHSTLPALLNLKGLPPFLALSWELGKGEGGGEIPAPEEQGGNEKVGSFWREVGGKLNSCPHLILLRRTAGWSFRFIPSFQDGSR